jgi:hypothetical protein
MSPRPAPRSVRLALRRKLRESRSALRSAAWSCAAACCALLASACASEERALPRLGSAEVVADFDSYVIRRVGILPFADPDGGIEPKGVLQGAFYAELQRCTPYDLLLLDNRDLEEIQRAEPHRRGALRPDTLIALARRYRLDAVLFGTILQQQLFPPQMLSLRADLVSAETGQVLWSGRLHLDANRAEVRDGLRAYYGEGGGPTSGDPSWELALLAPARLARFAAWQVALLL